MHPQHIVVCECEKVPVATAAGE